MRETRVRDDRVRRAIRDLERAGPAVFADALNRTAFEILDAEERAIRSAFTFAGPTTARFIARGFQFDKATRSRLRVVIRAKPRANALLLDHVVGAQIDATDGERLAFDRRLAVPIRANVKRSARGKVPARVNPQKVTAPGGRGFVSRSGDAILQRFGPRGARVRVLFALVERAKLRVRFDHVKVAAETVRREFPAKARRAIQKAAEKAGARPR